MSVKTDLEFFCYSPLLEKLSIMQWAVEEPNQKTNVQFKTQRQSKWQTGPKESSGKAAQKVHSPIRVAGWLRDVLVVLTCLSLCNTQARAVNLIHAVLCDDEGITRARGC